MVILNKAKASFVSAISWLKVFIHIAIWLAEWKAKKTPNKWDDKLVSFLKRLL